MSESLLFYEMFGAYRVAIRGIFYNQNGEILFVHHRNGMVLLPGGHVELEKDSVALYPNLMEALFAGFRREIEEELGVDDGGWDLMDVSNNFRPKSLINWNNADGFCLDFIGSMP